MEEKKAPKPKIQNLLLENRQKLSLSGILDVESFNDEYVLMMTELGTLTIRGENLRISKLNLDNSEVIIEGEIVSCEYSDSESTRASKGFGFFGKMFK